MIRHGNIVLPYMASLIAKKKGNKLYYYVVESARVDGKPRIVHQAYLGTAEKVAALVKDRTAPIPLAASTREFGLPAALWLPPSKPASLNCSASLWPAPLRTLPRALSVAGRHPPHLPARPQNRSGRLVSHSILSALWEFPAERFTSQAFWDASNRSCPKSKRRSMRQRSLEQAQIRLLGLWKEKQLVSRRLLAYDTTNFYTYIASTNTRNQLAQRGHNKQGRHNLRQVGLSYVLDGEKRPEPVPSRLSRERGRCGGDSRRWRASRRMLDRNQIARETVTLVLDKGSAALANTVELEEAGVGWISALPWNQAPAELRSRAVEELPACSSAQPGVRASGREDAGARAGISVRGEVLGFLCRRATAQSDHQSQQGAAIPAPFGQGTE